MQELKAKGPGFETPLDLFFSSFNSCAFFGVFVVVFPIVVVEVVFVVSKS